MLNKEQKEINAKAEAIMMGMTQPVKNLIEARGIIHYILQTLRPCTEITAQEVINNTFKYTKDLELTHIGVSTLSMMGSNFVVINLVLGKKGKKSNITNRNGVLTYVHNIDAPDLSELGYVRFTNDTGVLKRVS